MYHTHPTGVAYPSPEDIQSGQRFHFIICYENPKAPILNVFEIIAKPTSPNTIKNSIK